MSIKIGKKITKEYILSRVSEKQIFAKYFNITEAEINDCICNRNHKLHSPIRKDNNPSFGFTYGRSGKLKARDFAGYFWGDCFDAVGYVLGKNVSNNKDFKYILDHIASSFLLFESGTEINTPVVNTIHYNKIRTKIDVQIRDWTRYDLLWWARFAVNKTVLTYYDVYPIQYVWFDKDINPYPRYEHRGSDPCYGYYFGKDKDGFDLWKLYFPNRKRTDIKPRFISNNNTVQGLNKIVAPGQVLLITKSMKDIMSIVGSVYEDNTIKCSFLIRGEQITCEIVAPASESTPLPKDGIDWIKSNFKNAFSLLDFDRTGVKMANYYRKFGITPLFLTNGKFNSMDYKSKDYAEYVYNNGVSKGKRLIIKVSEELLNKGLLVL